MRFINYLIEASKKNGRHALTYQKLLQALDTSHVKATDTDYSFNLGAIVKDSTLSGLNVIIKQGTPDAKLGQKKDGSMVLVVTTDKLPKSRKDIDTLLSTDEAIMNKFISSIEKYFTSYRDKSKEEDKYPQEKTEELTDNNTIEDKYKALTDRIDALNDEFNKASSSIEDGADVFKNATNSMAKMKLKTNYFGNDENDFVKMMLKLPEADFIKMLSKDQSKKILSRLNSYRIQMD